MIMKKRRKKGEVTARDNKATRDNKERELFLNTY
jgi:hypothetical protein